MQVSLRIFITQPCIPFESFAVFPLQEPDILLSPVIGKESGISQCTGSFWLVNSGFCRGKGESDACVRALDWAGIMGTR